MASFEGYQRELDGLEQGKCRFAWDELEELMTESFQEEEISSEEYDTLMRRLMEIDCAGESGMFGSGNGKVRI